MKKGEKKSKTYGQFCCGRFIMSECHNFSKGRGVKLGYKALNRYSKGYSTCTLYAVRDDTRVAIDHFKKMPNGAWAVTRASKAPALRLMPVVLVGGALASVWYASKRGWL